jgi:hypothetical protein
MGLLEYTYERGPSLVGSSGSSCRYNRFLSCLGCFIQPSTNIIFLPAHFFPLFVPICPATWSGGQAVVLGRQSLCLRNTQRLQKGWNSFCLIENIQEELCLTTTLMERALDQKTRKTKMSKACRNMCPDLGHHVRILGRISYCKKTLFFSGDGICSIPHRLLANLG